MKAFSLIVILLTVIAGTAEANITLPYGNLAPGTLATDCARQGGPNGWCPEAGIGDDGAVTCDGDGTSIIFHTNGQLDCWFYTGWNPGTSGYVEVPNNQTMQPSPSTNQKHCIGFMSLALTAVQYQAGYPVADWPDGMQIWQDQETASGSNQNAFEHFGWKSTWGTALAPYTTYAYHMSCPIQ
jgi:hypothetical protein